MAGRDAGRCFSQAFCLVYKFASHHQCVNHTDSNLDLPVIKHQRPGMKPLVHLACRPLQETPADNHGKLLGRDIQFASPGAKQFFRCWRWGFCGLLGKWVTQTPVSRQQKQPQGKAMSNRIHVMLPPKFLSLFSLNLAFAAENKCRLFAK